MTAPARAASRATPGALVLAAGVNLFLGCSFYATKHALEGLPELTVAAIRSVVAALVLAPFAGVAALRALASGGGRSLAVLVAMGVLGYALPVVLALYGLRHSTATNAALLIGVEPVAIAVLGAIALRERLGGLRLVALALGTVGATTIVAGGLPFFGTAYAPHLLGDSLLVASGAAWAIYTIAGKPLLARHSSLAVTVGALLVALPVLLPLAALELRSFAPGPALATSVGWAIGLGVLSSGLGAVLWNRALETLDASQLAGFVFLQPIAGVLLGTLALGESVSRWALGGGVLVFAGVYALVLEERRRS